ncbi:MAG: type I-E CRISPR-associated protein Cse1/CasA [Acidobacteriales bacterium]|nr:type I-E CRISPR-associated protein Cse1/CasA [Terriglobales bacterium]
MNLLEGPWIPVRARGGTGEFRLLTYRQLLCEPGDWQVSLPRDDLELACLQLLVCMTQVMFLPEDVATLRARLATTLTPEEFAAGIAPCHDWFDLDHPTQPFMQSRGVIAAEDTPIQKLLIGLPEGNNHAFFNEAGEARHLSGTVAAIALFNQAANCPSFGGGFKGSLRGGAPITTLVFGSTMREIVWRNVLTRPNLAARQIAMPGFNADLPTWVKPIAKHTKIYWNEIGLARGLFWQPARVELVKSAHEALCGVLGGAPVPGYSGLRKEKFNYTIEGVWPHPHGALNLSRKKDALKQKFASFTTIAPAWTQLSEFVVLHSLDGNAKEGSTPAGAVTQAIEMGVEGLSLLIGGYRANQASVLERRHELIGLAQGWRDNNGRRLPELVSIGRTALIALRSKLLTTAKGYEEKKRGFKLKGVGAFDKQGKKYVGLHDLGEKLFYARTENLIHQTFSNRVTWKEWSYARARFAEQIAEHCRSIFEELTQPYAAKPELIPVIAWSRRSLNTDLNKLTEEA